MDIQKMKKLVAFAVAGAFLGAASLTTFSTVALAADKKDKVVDCSKFKNEKAQTKCMEREAKKAEKAAKKMKGDMKKPM
jgi:hypothetical protein